MSKNRRDRKPIRRQEAETRNAQWAALSLPEQLDQLNKRFGVGVGALKQRMKIAKKISNAEAKATK